MAVVMPLAHKPVAARVMAVAIAAALALGLLASSGRSTTASKWRMHRIKEAGTLRLPATWRDMTKQTPAVEAAIRRAAARNPQVAPFLYALTVGMKAYVKFVGADFARASLKHGFATNLNILGQRTPVSLDAWANANLHALRRTTTVLRPIRTQWVRLPAGRALALRFKQKVPAGARLATVAVTQYAVKRGGSVYLLTYSTTPAQARAYARVFAKSARSLRLR
jgi:hypothetical protein